jgi:alpha-L-rhamnosidase
VRKTAVEQSYNGRYFMDHALRDETGKLCLQDHSSEACQYYAILFGGIDWNAPRFQPLKELVVSVFSPDRGEKMPEIIPVNAFIGAYLRIEALLKMGEHALLLDDLRGFFGKMEERTGTLWEYRQYKGSYDHGFASYAVVAAMKAAK